jgi:DNA-binding MarR family transcriptional regulator
MSETLQAEIKQTRPFGSPEEEAYLNLMRTANALEQGVTELLKSYGLTGTQYNVLRILRGAGTCGLPCGEAAERMVTRDPDMTRLLDRLEKMGAIERERSTEDRRVVITRLRAEGRALVDRLDEPMAELHRQLLGHLDPEELRTLTALLTKVRAG